MANGILGFLLDLVGARKLGRGRVEVVDRLRIAPACPQATELGSGQEAHDARLAGSPARVVRTRSPASAAGHLPRIMRQRILPAIDRPRHILVDRRPVGPAELFAEQLSDFARAGVQRTFIWPVADEHRQLELFCEKVRPAIAA